MIDMILGALKRAGIDEYRIKDSVNEHMEAFFVKKRLDLKRIKDTRWIRVTVFNVFEEDGKKYRGSADVYAFNGMSEDELVQKFSDAKHAAGFVKNEYWDFGPANTGSTLKGLPGLEDAMKTMTEALFAADCDDKAFVNSAEIFIEKHKTHILSSNGTDVEWNDFRVNGEFVTQCREPQDVETYMDFEYDSPEAGSLTKLVRDTLETTKARATAKETPKAGKYRVIISGRYVKDIFSYYTDRTNSAFVYAKYSDYKVGDAIQGDEINGDAFNITLKALDPYSAEGLPMKDRSLLCDGKVQVLHGPERFAKYLGIEPTGSYNAFEVVPGNVSFEDMKKEPYLNIVNFSDFQMDSMNGSFGGEIRLAFLFDGEKTVPVTGGSVNGNIIELQKNVKLSSDVQTQLDYTGPYAICFDSISVAGE